MVKYPSLYSAKEAERTSSVEGKPLTTYYFLKMHVYRYFVCLHTDVWGWKTEEQTGKNHISPPYPLLHFHGYYALNHSATRKALFTAEACKSVTSDVQYALEFEREQEMKAAL